MPKRDDPLDELKRLVASRGQCKGIVTKTDNFLRNPNSDRSDIELLKVKKERLISAFNSFSELHIEVQVLNPADTEDFDEIEERFCKLLADLNTAIINLAGSNEGSSRSPAGSDSQFQRLPRIVIKSFNGDMKKKAAALETLAQTSIPQQYERQRRTSLASSLAASNDERMKKIKCKYCSSNIHRLYVCPKFRLASAFERNEFINKNERFCSTCLNEHSEKCRFNFKCAVCKAPHNTLLHQDTPADNLSGSSIEELQSVASTSRAGLLCSNQTDVILPTVELHVKAKDGTYIKTRALLDSGSQVSFVLSSLIDNIQCDKHTENNTIVGICNGKSHSQEMANFNIHSCSNNFQLKVKCCVVNKITDDMPQFHLSKKDLNIPENITLADENFDKMAPITILLGCDIFFQALLHHVRPLSLDGPFLVSTQFGHVVAGAVPTQHALIKKTSLFAISKVSQSHSTFESESILNENLRQFWEAEKVPEVFPECSTEQDLAEISFKDSVILKEGKFQVALPLKQPMTDLDLGDSFSSALQRFLNLEKRLVKDSSLYQRYKDFIREYIELGHAEVFNISKYDLVNDAVYFLPHHPVFNEQSKTTKMRTVFDGSMLTKNKISLNDVLLNGPIVQSELFNVLVQFRFPKYILIADIKKMFRMIFIDPKYRPLQNILWRENVDSPISCIQLKTVTYGLKSSSFLATRCLLELAQRFKDDFPLAVEVLRQQTYIDDINTGHDNIHVLLQIKDQLIELLKLGGFELHKWCANNQQLLDGIPKEKLSFNNDVDINKDELFVKTLGLRYNVSSDTFFINCPQTDIQDKYTRRQVLSFISRFYDPLGLVGPLFVSSKIILQKICQLHCSWDDELPLDLNEEWKEFAKSLVEMSSIKINRHIDMRDALKIELVGYADASNRAYGCALYLRVVNNSGSVSVNLLCSKSRICPINKILSTPRLELNSALLLSMLVNKVYNILNTKYDFKVYLYLDSMIVLAWLNIEPMKLQAYVANRVKIINELTCNFAWFYVPTDQNPADCVSRGVQPHLLQKNLLWWHAPLTLHDKEFTHFKTNLEAQIDLPELTNASRICNVINSTKDFNFISKYSNIDTIKRVMAYVLRFSKNCRTKKESRMYDKLSPTELENALHTVIKFDQHHNYSLEIACLKVERAIKGSLSSLSPYLDKNEMLRVSGRLQNSELSYSAMHPIILVKGSNITKLIILKAHKQLMHASQKAILCYLNEKYWLIDALREIKSVIHKCVICFKLKARNATQLMGSLPKQRVRVARPFERVGIDYAGPFSMKFARVRKPVLHKGYVLIFVCFVTKAIHIELASDMTTENFLNCLKRFIARRNKPSQIFCDNAATFRCANSQLQDLYKLQSSTDHISSVNLYTADQGIEFKFVPAYSPVFAGLWEAGVKSIKYHLKRVVGNNVLTYEEFNTVLIRIEGMLNSRPLTSMSSDPNDMSYLSPGHFLTGAPLTSYPEPDVTNKSVNRLSFWRQCMQIQQNFFKQWSKQYLTMLQHRPKWRSDEPNLKIGTLVILRCDNISPLKWPMARVVNVYPGNDNKVRALDVKTSSGHIMRTSVMKVCPLPIDE